MQATGLPAPTQELAYAFLQGMFTDKIQQRLDDFARSKGKSYDNMISLCTYATSKKPIFSIKGQYGVEARDATRVPMELPRQEVVFISQQYPVLGKRKSGNHFLRMISGLSYTN